MFLFFFRPIIIIYKQDTYRNVHECVCECVICMYQREREREKVYACVSVLYVCISRDATVTINNR